jgi:hypothetical protein
VQVWFEQGGDYKVGDYWQIPARTAAADVLWPQETGPDGELRPKALPPRGIVHRIAPLRPIELDANGRVTCYDDCRCVFPSLCMLAMDRGERPTRPEPGETTAPIGSIEYEVETARPVEASSAVLAANISRLSEALSADELVRVDLLSIHVEPGEFGVELARKRAEQVGKAYLEAGIPASMIKIAGVRLAPGGAPQVRTNMVTRTSATERPVPGRETPVRVPVNDVPGIGDTSAGRLEMAGVADAAALARLDEDKLIEILSTPGGRAFPRARAVEILRAASALSGES